MKNETEGTNIFDGKDPLQFDKSLRRMFGNQTQLVFIFRHLILFYNEVLFDFSGFIDKPLQVFLKRPFSTLHYLYKRMRHRGNLHTVNLWIRQNDVSLVFGFIVGFFIALFYHWAQR